LATVAGKLTLHILRKSYFDMVNCEYIDVGVRMVEVLR